jgi:hypothetical protein
MHELHSCSIMMPCIPCLSHLLGLEGEFDPRGKGPFCMKTTGFLSLSRLGSMINLASPGDLKRGFAIGPMRKAYFYVSYYKFYGQVPQSALNRRGNDNLHESLSRQCSTEASGL